MKGLPWAAITACMGLVIATGLTVAGIYILAGVGWAMLAGAGPFFVLAVVIFRGLNAK